MSHSCTKCQWIFLTFQRSQALKISILSRIKSCSFPLANAAGQCIGIGIVRGKAFNAKQSEANPRRLDDICNLTRRVTTAERRGESHRPRLGRPRRGDGSYGPTAPGTGCERALPSRPTRRLSHAAPLESGASKQMQIELRSARSRSAANEDVNAEPRRWKIEFFHPS